VRAGRNLERADMTTRIVDSAVFVLMPRKDQPSAYDNILWVNVLKSLSAFQMYRQHVRNRVDGDAVIRYLIKDAAFPRSVAFTIAEAQVAVSTLPRNKAPMRAIGRLQRRLNEAEIQKMSLDELHAFIDELQAGFNNVHEQIWGAWFRLDQTPTASVASQAQSPLQTA
jgi:uncharacterized alpha-E superfamily protein